MTPLFFCCVSFLSNSNYEFPGAGTLYAGDGVVIQQPEDIQSDFHHGCVAILRYPRSTFSANGNVTLCVCCSKFYLLRLFQLIFFLDFSLWARAQSTTARRWRRSMYHGSDVFQPDAQFVNSQDGNVTEYGRLNIQFLSNGTVFHNLQPAQGSVSDSEIILNIRLTFVDSLTLYAVRRVKIESYQNEVTTRLTPMQPSLQRSKAVFDGYFVGKPKPLDFTCTELDLSSIPQGTLWPLPPGFPHVLFCRITRGANYRLFRRHR